MEPIDRSGVFVQHDGGSFITTRWDSMASPKNISELMEQIGRRKIMDRLEKIFKPTAEENEIQLPLLLQMFSLEPIEGMRTLYKSK